MFIAFHWIMCLSMINKSKRKCECVGAVFLEKGFHRGKFPAISSEHKIECVIRRYVCKNCSLSECDCGLSYMKKG